MTLHHEWRCRPDGWAHAFRVEDTSEVLTALGDCFYTVDREHTSSGLVVGTMCLVRLPIVRRWR